MTIQPRKVKVVVYIAECPICSKQYVILDVDIKRKTLLKCACGYSAASGSWPLDEDRTVNIVFSNTKTTVSDEL